MAGKWGKYQDYQEYIASDEWKLLSDHVKRRAGLKCQICNSSLNLNAHHRTYENGLFETGENIICVCRRCHKSIAHVTDEEDIVIKNRFERIEKAAATSAKKSGWAEARASLMEINYFNAIVNELGIDRMEWWHIPEVIAEKEIALLRKILQYGSLAYYDSGRAVIRLEEDQGQILCAGKMNDCHCGITIEYLDCEANIIDDISRATGLQVDAIDAYAFYRYCISEEGKKTITRNEHMKAIKTSGLSPAQAEVLADIVNEGEHNSPVDMWGIIYRRYNQVGETPGSLPMLEIEQGVVRGCIHTIIPVIATLLKKNIISVFLNDGNEISAKEIRKTLKRIYANRSENELKSMFCTINKDGGAVNG